MAQRVIPFTVTTAAGITQSNPQVTNLQFAPADVVQIDIFVPPGPAGFLGFFIGNGGGNFIPEGIGKWIIPDDVYMTFPTEGAPNNGNWSVTTYNVGNYAHTLYFFFHVNNLVLGQAVGSSSPIGL